VSVRGEGREAHSCSPALFPLRSPRVYACARAKALRGFSPRSWVAAVSFFAAARLVGPRAQKKKKTRKKTHTHAHLLFSLSFTHSTGKELNARRSAKQLESRGEKFRALKAKEAAKKAAAQAASAGGGGGSGGGNGAAAQAEAAPAPKAGAVATDPARPVVPDAPPPKNNSGTGGSA
jgi:hypothetical protein